MHRVVKPFPYSVDGFTLIDLNVGDERDFGAMTGGLVGEGFVEPVSVVKAEPIVVEHAVAIEPAPAEQETAEPDEAPFEMAVDQPRRGRRRG